MINYLNVYSFPYLCSQIYYFWLMKSIIRFIVERSDPKNVGRFVELYRNTIEVDDALKFDFSPYILVFKSLYKKFDPVVKIEIL